MVRGSAQKRQWFERKPGIVMRRTLQQRAPDSY
jgi:hypothetical protein